MSKVLLVDDDIELTELLSELLSFEGFDIHISHNGREALVALEKEHFDIVLLDVMMPVLNGIETLKQLRQKYNLPVLMLSARDDDINSILGLELGADDYLSKPFNNRELIARIRAILRRTSNYLNKENPPQEEDDCQIIFNDIELQLGQQQAFYKGKSLALTGTEFALFEILVRNVGKIVSREILSLEALNKHLTPYDRSVDMHISNLRKKLPERKDKLPWFKAFRGRGYLLITVK